MASTNSPLITLEEHFLSKAALAVPNKFDQGHIKQVPVSLEKLTDLGPIRIQNMDDGQVTLQVVSHGAGELSSDQCRDANDQLAEAVQSNPTRFAGFAFLPMSNPEEAAAELRRTCTGGTKNGVRFVGALIDNHTAAGGYYESSDYDVLWRMASEDLDVPIYLHPTWPSEGLFKAAYKSESVPEDVTTSISTSGFGWHSDVATHVLRLFAAGVFDRFPKLKIVIGHMGEMIPFMLQRIEKVTSRWAKRERPFRQVWDENIWITTSGVWSLDPLTCILRNTKSNRILYSVDYPFVDNKDGLAWLREVENSGLVGKEELEGIRWRNAASLLKLDLKV